MTQETSGLYCVETECLAEVPESEHQEDGLCADCRAAGASGTNPERPFSVVDFVIAYEGGDLDEQEVIEGFQELIDSGVVWHLQGSYGRTAARLIEAGYCFRPGEQPQGPYLRALIAKNRGDA